MRFELETEGRSAQFSEGQVLDSDFDLKQSKDRFKTDNN